MLLVNVPGDLAEPGSDKLDKIYLTLIRQKKQITIGMSYSFSSMKENEDIPN